MKLGIILLYIFLSLIGLFLNFYGIYYGFIKGKILKYSRKYFDEEMNARGYFKNIMSVLIDSYFYRFFFEYNNPNNIYYTGLNAKLFGMLFILISIIPLSISFYLFVSS